MTMDADHLLDRITSMKSDHRPFALATVVRTQDVTSAKAGAKAIVRPDGSMEGWIGGGCTEGAVRKAAMRTLDDGKARLLRVRPGATESGDMEGFESICPGGDMEEFESSCPSGGTLDVFIEPILPRPALVIAGASPVARALCDLAKRMGYAVTVAASRGDVEVFAEADRRIEGFDLTADPRAESSFVVVATQGKGDREALEGALASGAGYVAFVSSRRKAAKLKQDLIDRGADPDRVGVIRAPAGLDIGAATAEEIALSILADIVRERRLGPATAKHRSAKIEPRDEATAESRVAAPDSGGCCHGDTDQD